MLMKNMMYGYMRKQISSHALEACCLENLHFIYLLEGQRVPDHNTLNRFQKNTLMQEAEQDILPQLVALMHLSGLLNLESAFIDIQLCWEEGDCQNTDRLLKKIYT